MSFRGFHLIIAAIASLFALAAAAEEATQATLTLHKILGWNKITCDTNRILSADGATTTMDLTFALKLHPDADDNTALDKLVSSSSSSSSSGTALPAHRARLQTIAKAVFPKEDYFAAVEAHLPMSKCARHGPDSIRCMSLRLDEVEKMLRAEALEQKKLQFCLYEEDPEVGKNIDKNHRKQSLKRRVFLSDASVIHANGCDDYPVMPAPVEIFARQDVFSRVAVVQGLHLQTSRPPRHHSKAAPTVKRSQQPKSSSSSHAAGGGSSGGGANTTTQAPSTPAPELINYTQPFDFPSPLPEGRSTIVEAFQHFRNGRYRYYTFAVTMNCYSPPGSTTGEAKAVLRGDWCAAESGATTTATTMSAGAEAAAAAATAHNNHWGVHPVASFMRFRFTPLPNFLSGGQAASGPDVIHAVSSHINYTHDCRTGAQIAWASSRLAHHIICYVEFADELALPDNVPLNFEVQAVFKNTSAAPSSSSWVSSPWQAGFAFHSGNFSTHMHGVHDQPSQMWLVETPGFVAGFDTSANHGSNLTDIGALYELPKITGASELAPEAAVIEFQLDEPGSGFWPHDVDLYLNFTHSHFSNRSQQYVLSGPWNETAGGETALDIELLVGLNSPAHMRSGKYLVLTLTGDGFASVIADALAEFVAGTAEYLDRIDPTVFSISWGTSSLDYKHEPEHALRADRFFRLLQASGVTVTASSGDQGALQFNYLLGPSASFPAAMPHCVGVGATTPRQHVPPAQQHHSGGAGKLFRLPTTAQGMSGITSGGGFTDTWLRAPPYQHRFLQAHGHQNIVFFQNGTENPVERNKRITANRGMPDVAALGSSVLVFSHGEKGLMAGTSASSPIIAAIIARLNADLQLDGIGPIRWMNEFFYHVASTVDDAFAVVGRSALSSSGVEPLESVSVDVNSNCAGEGSSHSWMNFELQREIGCWGADASRIPVPAPSKGVSAAQWSPVSGLGSPRYPRLLQEAKKWQLSGGGTTTTTTTSTTSTTTVTTQSTLATFSQTNASAPSDQDVTSLSPDDVNEDTSDDTATRAGIYAGVASSVFVLLVILIVVFVRRRYGRQADAFDGFDEEEGGGGSGVPYAASTGEGMDQRQAIV